MKQRPFLAVFLVSILLACALFWPLPMHLHTHWTPSAFASGHIWVADHLFTSLIHLQDPHHISELGHPFVREARFIGWAPVVASWPLRPILGPIGAFQLIGFVSLGLSALLAAHLIHRVTACRRGIAAGAGLLYAFSPYCLAVLQTGESPKAQIWLLPFFLLALLTFEKSTKKAIGLVAAATLVTSFTSPYYGLALPLLACIFALQWLLKNRRKDAFLLLLTVALSLLPALFYYGGHPTGTEAFFRPAVAREVLVGELPRPHPVASLSDLFFGNPKDEWEPMMTVHQSGLGLFLIVATLLSLWKGASANASARRFGYTLLVFGVLLSMGPRFSLHNHASVIPLPAALLEFIGYPLKSGGMYYRMVPLATLGLLTLLCSSLPHTKKGFLLMMVLVPLQTIDALRLTGPWPMTTEETPHHPAFLNGSPDDGAVFSLPLRRLRNPSENQRTMLRQIGHGRPETALSFPLPMQELKPLEIMLKKALSSPNPSVSLRSEGFRFLSYSPEPHPEAHPNEKAILTTYFGDPIQSGDLLIWDMGPARLQPRPPPQVGLHISPKSRKKPQ